MSRKRRPTKIDIQNIIAGMFERDANECWNWKGYFTGSGYPQIMIDGKHTKVHRLVYLAFHGYEPKRILRTCGNRHCINPNHFIGSS